MIGASALLCVILLAGAAPAITEDAGAAPEASEEWLEVSAHVAAKDGGTIAVGEPFHLLIEARHAVGQVALLPEDLPFDSRVSERKSARTHRRDGDAKVETDRYDLELLAFEPGEIEIAKIPLALGSTRAATPALKIEIGTGFRDSELPIATSTRAEAMAELEKMAAEDPSTRAVLIDDYRPLYAACGLAALVLAGLLIRRLWTRKRPQEVSVAPVAPPRPAHEVALERLEALRRSGLLEKKDFKAFFAVLSEILREYAGARYGFESLELTVDELIDALAPLRTPGLESGRLKTLLDRADLVKFAKYAPDTVEASDALNTAFAIVEQTRPLALPGAPVAVAAAAPAQREQPRP